MQNSARGLVLDQGSLSEQDCLRILDVNDLDTMELVAAAHQRRKEFFGNRLSVHMINNACNGHCSEDCKYCVQSKFSTAALDREGAKDEMDIVREAIQAYQKGADCYGLVYSGKGLFDKRLDQIVRLVVRIKAAVPLTICASVGFVDRDQAKKLKDAGVDRLHHNLNTSEDFYPKICTTHSYNERIKTLEAAQSAGLPVCCGLIVGMGESPRDVVSTAMRLKELKPACVPVNFYIPLKGAPLGVLRELSVEYCLRVLCLFRLINPRAELCLAAGRELYLQSVQPLVLQIVDGIFMNGYLNVSGDERDDVLEIAQKFGFSIVQESR